MNGDKVLGMIGCLVLGGEMAHVLESDPALENVLIVDDGEGRAFRDMLDPDTTGLYVQMVGLEELGDVEFSGPSVVVWIKEASLHDSPPSLLESLTSSIHTLEGPCGAILLFYGLCRSTKSEVERFVESFDVPVMFLTDDDGVVVDDCFVAVLGGQKRYMDIICRSERAMLMTTGYAQYWTGKQEGNGLEAMVEQYENFDHLFKTLGYKKVMMLDNGLGDREEFRERAKEFASMFDLSVETIRCDMTMFESSYRRAWSKLSIASSVQGVGTEVVLSKTLP